MSNTFLIHNKYIQGTEKYLKGDISIFKCFRESQDGGFQSIESHVKKIGGRLKL